jgi:hypothetical protein
VTGWIFVVELSHLLLDAGLSRRFRQEPYELGLDLVLDGIETSLRANTPTR